MVVRRPISTGYTLDVYLDLAGYQFVLAENLATPVRRLISTRLGLRIKSRSAVHKPPTLTGMPGSFSSIAELIRALTHTRCCASIFLSLSTANRFYLSQPRPTHSQSLALLRKTLPFEADTCK